MQMAKRNPLRQILNISEKFVITQPNLCSILKIILSTHFGYFVVAFSATIIIFLFSLLYANITYDCNELET